jgi:hypothetical protein
MAVKATSMSASTGHRCPVCGEPSIHANRPFCSKRCADVDLARWLNGHYVIAGANRLSDEDAAIATPGPHAAESDEKGD